MTKRNSSCNLRLIFLFAVFLLLCGGIQSASSCLLPGDQIYSSEIRVDSCHLVIDQNKTTPCCQIEVCHQSAPQKRDLGSPEYHNQLNDSHSLVHESRPLTPQFKAGKPFVANHFVLPQFSALQRVSQIPLQSLYSLRTTVLLN